MPKTALSGAGMNRFGATEFTGAGRGHALYDPDRNCSIATKAR